MRRAMARLSGSGGEAEDEVPPVRMGGCSHHAKPSERGEEGGASSER